MRGTNRRDNGAATHNQENTAPTQDSCESPATLCYHDDTTDTTESIVRTVLDFVCGRSEADVAAFRDHLGTTLGHDPKSLQWVTGLVDRLAATRAAYGPEATRQRVEAELQKNFEDGEPIDATTASTPTPAMPKSTGHYSTEDVIRLVFELVCRQPGKVGEIKAVCRARFSEEAAAWWLNIIDAFVASVAECGEQVTTQRMEKALAEVFEDGEQIPEPLRMQRFFDLMNRVLAKLAEAFPGEENAQYCDQMVGFIAGKCGVKGLEGFANLDPEVIHETLPWYCRVSLGLPAVVQSGIRVIEGTNECVSCHGENRPTIRVIEGGTDDAA